MYPDASDGGFRLRGALLSSQQVSGSCASGIVHMWDSPTDSRVGGALGKRIDRYFRCMEPRSICRTDECECELLLIEPFPWLLPYIHAVESLGRWPLDLIVCCLQSCEG